MNATGRNRSRAIPTAPGAVASGRTRGPARGRFLAMFCAAITSLGTPEGTRAEVQRAAGGQPSPARADPTVDELCRAAVALALAEPERARGFIFRARAAGWLPELRFRMFRRFARTEGLTLDDTATTTPVDVSGVDDVRYEWRAT